MAPKRARLKPPRVSSLKITSPSPKRRHHSETTISATPQPEVQLEKLVDLLLAEKSVLPAAPSSEEHQIKVEEFPDEEPKLAISDEVRETETPQENILSSPDRYEHGLEKVVQTSSLFSIGIFTKFMNFLQLKNKAGFITTLIIIISIVSSISVTGLLQSTESVGSSGILVQTLPPTPPPPSQPPSPPEPRVEIDVYSDGECTSKLTQVEWGSIEAGGSINRAMYVKNAGDAEVTLSLLTDSWDPAAAEEYMVVSWDYDGEKLRSGEVLEITLTLTVEASISMLGEFHFDVVIVGSAL